MLLDRFSELALKQNNDWKALIRPIFLVFFVCLSLFKEVAWLYAKVHFFAERTSRTYYKANVFPHDVYADDVSVEVCSVKKSMTDVVLLAKNSAIS